MFGNFYGESQRTEQCFSDSSADIKSVFQNIDTEGMLRTSDDRFAFRSKNGFNLIKIFRHRYYYLVIFVANLREQNSVLVIFG